MRIVQSGPESWDIHDLTTEQLAVLHNLTGSLIPNGQFPDLQAVMESLFGDFEDAESQGITRGIYFHPVTSQFVTLTLKE